MKFYFVTTIKDEKTILYSFKTEFSQFLANFHVRKFEIELNTRNIFISFIYEGIHGLGETYGCF